MFVTKFEWPALQEVIREKQTIETWLFYFNSAIVCRFVNLICVLVFQVNFLVVLAFEEVVCKKYINK